MTAKKPDTEDATEPKPGAYCWVCDADDHSTNPATCAVWVAGP
ncbi:hypothetical protein [Nonomuraea sediminis]|nr:hypothetical protein [Nonomuraea sediminis]